MFLADLITQADGWLQSVVCSSTTRPNVRTLHWSITGGWGRVAHQTVGLDPPRDGHGAECKPDAHQHLPEVLSQREGRAFSFLYRFHKLREVLAADYPLFVECLRELVSIFEGDALLHCVRRSFMGITRSSCLVCGVAWRLSGWCRNWKACRRGSRLNSLRRTRWWHAFPRLIKASPERPQFADEAADDFVETLYMHLTGEILHGLGRLGDSGV